MSRSYSDRFSFEDAPAPIQSKRRNVVLQALLFTPAALLMGAGVLYASVKMAQGETGHIVMLVVASILFIVTAYQALHYLRDIRTEAVSSEGEISKKWTKSNLFFFFLPSYYIAVKGRIFTVSSQEYKGLLEEDMVRIRHYRHSLTVEFVERYDDVEKKFVPARSDGQNY